MAPPLILVAYAVDPGPGGAEAEVNARFVRALRDTWRAPVTVITAASSAPAEDGRPLDVPADWRVHALGECGEIGLHARAFNLAAAWSLARMRAGGPSSLPARAINRGTHIATGEGVKRAWQLTAARVLRQELATQPDALVYSRALPLASIQAVAHVRRTRTFPWIVNINDPIPNSLWPGLYSTSPQADQHAHAALTSAIPLVSAFTFPTARLRDLEYGRYPEMRGAPHAVLPHVGPRPATSHHASTGPDGNGRMTVTFLGVLRGNRVREEFFDGLRLFATADSAAARSTRVNFLVPERSTRLTAALGGLESMVEVSVSKEIDAFARAADAADVLLDLESEPDAPLLLTKVARAVGRGKPLWAVCEPGGTTWDLMRQHESGYVTPLRDASAVCASLRQIHTDWRDSRLASLGPSRSLVECFSGARIVSEFEALCSAVASVKERRAAPVQAVRVAPTL
jgi:hypothetical protein